MTTLYVLDQNFTTVGILDQFSSIIWRPSYLDIGDFELYISANSKNLELLQINNYIVRSSDISVNDEGKVTYKKVMIIKNIKLTTNVESGDFLTVTGRELKFLLNQRIVWSQTNLSGTAENAIRTLINQNAINPTDTKRKIPNLVLGASAGLTDTLEKQVTGDKLDQAIIDICTVYNYGWDIYVYDGKLVVSVYAGLDRSYNQSDKPYVVFSTDFDNLYNTEYEVNTESYTNTTLIGGEGEGIERVYTAVGTEATGLNRFEIFTDARDLSRNKDSESEIPLDEYVSRLQERGKENLATLQYTEGFGGEVISNNTFKYGEDFDLGDIVTVINDYGISKNTRVMSCIESESESGVKLLPQFNI